MLRMLPDIVGREPDLDAIDAFVQAMLIGFACLVLEGEPGIGETTLWREAVGRAGRLGIRVLSSRRAHLAAVAALDQHMLLIC
jgi:hypothetical protein